jgi:hypothetical protein
MSVSPNEKIIETPMIETKEFIRAAYAAMEPNCQRFVKRRKHKISVLKAGTRHPERVRKATRQGHHSSLFVIIRHRYMA